MNLHSNMVRFIIELPALTSPPIIKFTFQYGQIYYLSEIIYLLKFCFIYIPIWLDLLLMYIKPETIYGGHLHSNMVRFIISVIQPTFDYSKVFTFQYGQIYYLLPLVYSFLPPQFTFQYGQIYYNRLQCACNWYSHIYIPIWLDLL